MSTPLIDSLKQLSGNEDPYLSKRKEHRRSMSNRTQLDLRRRDGETLLVSVLDVSESGIGIVCRKSLPIDEEVGLRMAFADDHEFEPFVVRRETGTIGGFKIGVVAS